MLSESKPIFKVIRFTVEPATEFLATADQLHQRRIKPLIVRGYADMMLRGEWTLTNDAICKDVRGRLINGRHRLSAIVLADEEMPGIAIDMLVGLNLPLDSMVATDKGAARSFGDQFMIQGEKYAHALAATINVELGFEANGDWHPPAGARATFPRFQEFLDDYPELREIIPAWSGAAKNGRFPVPVVASLWRRMSEVATEEEADDFWAGVLNGVNLYDGDPRVVLRDRVAQTKRFNQSMPRRIMIGLTVKTWNYWRAGQSVSTKSLIFRATDTVRPLS
ncbi:MAG TPA: hypothetical protein VFI41_05050 [Gemmatimonadales bacterium]|nr:hypothetical protein [Gemmatimonadales bacterium]